MPPADFQEPAPELESATLARARAGERAAQEELLRRHYPAVHASAFRLLGNPEDAEDLAQECFVRAFRSLAFYRGDGPFLGWLRRILVHLAQDRYRARGRGEATEALPPELPGGREPGQELERRELARSVDAALGALSAPLRTALLLRTREGLEYGEIGTLTGVTPETARTRVMKARRALEGLLAHVLGTPTRSAARRRET
ncbi:MAG: RNA polymerase sigma factor [Planctomycetota bacterium]